MYIQLIYNHIFMVYWENISVQYYVSLYENTKKILKRNWNIYMIIVKGIIIIIII